MKKFRLILCLCAVVSASTLPFAASSRAQSPASPAQTTPESVDARSKELTTLFNEVWQDRLKHSPETATYLGDKRYDTDLSDLSPRAVNDALQRERGYMERLSAIDTTGLPHQQQLSAELMLRSMIEDQEGARFKEWEMPVNQYDGLQLQLPQLVEHTSFDNTEDYDNYIARLGKIPMAFSQTMTNMQAGIDDHRTPPQYLMEKVLAQTQAIATQKPADSPFALPLKKFPASVSAADRQRISSAVRRHQPAGTPVLRPFRQIPYRGLHPKLPYRARHLGNPGWRRLLRLPHPPKHNAESLRSADPPDRPRPSQKR
jgi:uncharacterized protein (DUF885 family)